MDGLSEKSGVLTLQFQIGQESLKLAHPNASGRNFRKKDVEKNPETIARSIAGALAPPPAWTAIRARRGS